MRKHLIWMLGNNTAGIVVGMEFAEMACAASANHYLMAQEYRINPIPHNFDAVCFHTFFQRS